MAMQKRLNKNLIAFLTVMAMILVVSVFAMIVLQQSRRDPKALAASGQQAEQGGDLAEALRRYLQANEANRAKGESDTQYALAAARCLFAMGEIQNWRGLLVKEMAAKPGDVELRRAFLDGVWLVHDISGATMFALDLRDTARKLTETDPNDALALASTALALWALKGDEDQAAADAAAQTAFELDGAHPRAALAYVILLQRRYIAEYKQAQQDGARKAQLNEIVRSFTSQVQQAFEAAVAAHPGDAPIVTTLAGLLQDEGQRLLSDEADSVSDEAARQTATAAAGELFARAGQVLQTALAQQEETTATANLHATIASYLYGQLLREKGPLLTQYATEPQQVPAAERDDLTRRLAEIEQHATRATELEPALYSAYTLLSEIKQYETGPNGEALNRVQRYEKMLAVLDAGRERTLTLRSLRAQLRVEERLLLLRRGYDLALAWWVDPNETGRRTENLARAEVFLKDAQVKYPEHPLTHYMEGQALVARDQIGAAIGAYQQAYDRVEQLRFNQGRLWRNLGTGRLPSEQLALLYRQQGQSGEAQRFAAAAIREYRDAGLRPPVPLLVNTAELLAQNNKPQEALDLLNAYRADYPDSQEFTAVRAAVLTRLNPEEGKQALQEVTGSDVATKLWRSRWAAEQGDLKAAEDTLRDVMSDVAATDRQVRDALQQLIGVLSTAGRRSAARTLVQDLLKNPPRASLVRMLKLYDVDLAVEDPEALTADERKAWEAQRLAIIAENPDPQARAAEYVAYYIGNRDWEQALTYLTELRKFQPDALEYAEQEFRIRLVLGQYREADELSGKLAKYSDGRGFDRAGGAIYRGELALSQGNAEAAIREFRQAVNVLPKSDELQIKLARGYLIGGRAAEAQAALQQAVEFNPRSFTAYYLLRQLYKQQAAESHGSEREDLENQARKYQATAMELNPRDPQVQTWKREQDEETNPLAAIVVREKTRARSPDDADNLVRLARLYVSAWKKAADANDDAAKGEVLRGAEPFFQATATAEAGLRTELLANAAELYVLGGQTEKEKGESLLRGFLEQATGENKINAQLLLAQFFQNAGNQAGAEREVQQAQRLTAEVTSDPQERRRLEQRIGLAMINFYDTQRRPDKVAETCRWLLDRLGAVNKSDADAQGVRLMLIQSLFGTGQLDDAKAEIETFQREYPDDVRGRVARAQLALQRHDRQEAWEDLGKVLEKDPEHAWAYLTRGRLALEQGRYDAARADLTKAKTLVFKSPALELDVHRALADLYQRTKEFEFAETELRAVLTLLEKQGDRALAQRQQIVAQLVRLISNSLKQFDRAHKLIDEKRAKYPDDPSWPYELGLLFATRAASQKDPRDARRDYDQAASYFQRTCERVADKNPTGLLRPMLGRMEALTKAGRPQEALNLGATFPFQKLPPTTPEELAAEIRARLGVEMANALMALNQSEQAMQQWQAALRDAANRSGDLAATVVLELQKATPAQPEQAEAIIRSVVESAAGNTLVGQRLRFVLATYLSNVGRGAAALPLLTEVLGQVTAGSPEHQHALLAQGITLQMAGDVAGALKSYRELLAAYPDDASALNNLAYLLATCDPPLNAPAEALKYAERLRGVMRADQQGAAALDTIGWVYFKNGKHDLAAAALEEAIGLSGPSAAMNEHLGEVYQAQGRTAEARAVLTQGLDLARPAGPAQADLARQIEEQLNKLR
jgi:tetratricopeptide (TPR) repeat protein